MDSTPPQPIGPGQRVLAAIVFTDVVNFSARMQAEEEATLGLLKRDFEMMRKLGEKYSGAVLKTTGDGLLLYFSSAVQAVAYALKMQRRFAENARSQPADETLTHRVGIHLGDVFVHDEDVMGDGVNIAARLQAEAEPGGICISQTVYDVVKNKLELEVIKLGPRELKNISSAVSMYRVLLESLKPAATGAGLPAPAFPVSAAPPPFSLTKTQKVVAVAGLVVVLAVVTRLVVRAHFEHEEELARSQATQSALGAALLGEKTANPDKKTVEATAAVEYNFAEMTRNQPAKENGTTKEARLIWQLANGRMQTMLGWMEAAMLRYTADRPLLVRELPGATSKETKVFTGPDRRLYFAEGGAIRQRNWTDLKPTTQGAVIVSALLDSPTPPPREVVQGAEAFAYLNGLPELNEALRAGHLGSGQK